MQILQLQKRLNRLPVSKQEEVSDFIDFLLSKQEKEPLAKTPVFGCAKGRFQMADDFNAPLEDFKEYM
jgi:hypothetical protein